MKAVLVLIAAIAFAISPFLSSEFGGFDPERYPIPQRNSAVQPAGWAFGIWGIIYLGLIVHAVFGVFKYKTDAAWDRGRIALLVSLTVGAIWLPVALLSPIGATILIWVMLISVLISLYQSPGAAPSWVTGWPVALYAGWLSAASFVSIGLLLAGYGVLEEIPAAIVALVLATAFTAYNAYRLASWPYGAAVTWGFFGIAIANVGSSQIVAIASMTAAVLIFGFSVWRSASLR
tara:strand:- start:14057 stop:14755 length:699 start_codon:yes stop_codon:yes gene_type:complete